MKVLLLGPQGSGKSTVGAIVSQKSGLPIIGGGELLRNIPESHPRYEEINKILNEGNLVPQDFVAELIKERLALDDCAKGYILDSWGRAMIDFTYFDPGYDKVVVLNISRELSIKRITGRRICSENGKTYNIYTLPEEMLKECKGELVQRPDDTEEAVNKRLDIYYSSTAEVIEHFRKAGKLVEIDAEGSPEEVAQKVLTALGLADD